MSGLAIVAVGGGEGFSAGYYSSGLAVGAESAWLLVDCPHPIRKILRESGSAAGVALDVGDFAAVVVTHLHADHSSGLEGFGYFAHFVLGRRARLLAHPEVLAEVWDGHLAAGMRRLLEPERLTARDLTLGDYFDATPLAETGAVEVGPFRIECRRTIHHIPTTALRIRPGGRVPAVSAGTAFDPALIAWLADADLVVPATNHRVHTPSPTRPALPPAPRA